MEKDCVTKIKLRKLTHQFCDKDVLFNSDMSCLLQVLDCDWSPKRAPPLEKVFTICKKIVVWLKMDKRNVVVIQCPVSVFLTEDYVLCSPLEWV